MKQRIADAERVGNRVRVAIIAHATECTDPPNSSRFIWGLRNRVDRALDQIDATGVWVGPTTVAVALPGRLEKITVNLEVKT